MGLYRVEWTVVAIVEADDEDDAFTTAADAKHEIFGDVDVNDITLWGEVTTISDLPSGWDGDCIQYGGDGNTRLRELLAE